MSTADYAADAAQSALTRIAQLDRRVEMLETALTSVMRDYPIPLIRQQAQAGLEEQVAKRLWEMDGYTHWELAEQQQWPYRFKAREILALVASLRDNGTPTTTLEVPDGPG